MHINLFSIANTGVPLFLTVAGAFKKVDGKADCYTGGLWPVVDAISFKHKSTVLKVQTDKFITGLCSALFFNLPNRHKIILFHL